MSPTPMDPRMVDTASKVVILLFLVASIVCEGLCLVLALF